MHGINHENNKLLIYSVCHNSAPVGLLEGYLYSHTIPVFTHGCNAAMGAKALAWLYLQLQVLVLKLQLRNIFMTTPIYAGSPIDLPM
jgi:hypothetical protein